jgi:tRNA-dihydrouridine synthase B
MLTVHGRTRACGFSGRAELETIAAVKASARIPVIANGDISNPQEAREALRATGADGVMIGRAAHGRPWLFAEIEHFLSSGKQRAPLSAAEMREAVLEHLRELYALYGEEQGRRVARKHIGWYVRGLPGGEACRGEAIAAPDADAQLAAVAAFFDSLAEWRLAA